MKERDKEVCLILVVLAVLTFVFRRPYEWFDFLLLLCCYLLVVRFDFYWLKWKEKRKR